MNTTEMKRPTKPMTGARPSGNPIEAWLRAAVQNTPDMFRMEALTFMPTLTMSAVAPATTATMLIVQPDFVRVPDDQFFVMKKIRAFIRGSFWVAGDKVWRTPDPSVIGQFMFNVRSEGSNRDVFTTAIPLAACIGSAADDEGLELDFGIGHYVFHPGATIRVSFPTYPVSFKNYADAGAPSIPGNLSIGIVLMGVAASNLYLGEK